MDFPRNLKNHNMFYGGEKFFLGLFLILYVSEVQKIPTLCLVNFVRVKQLLQPHVNTLFSRGLPLWQNLYVDLNKVEYSIL